MTQYGKITHFDTQTGTGTISPLDGSGALPFMMGGMQQQPRSDETYIFETQTGDDGQLQATNLRMDDGMEAGQQQGQTTGSHGGFDQQGESENRHNQQAAQRSGVDGAGLVHGNDDSDSHGRSEHQSRTDGQEGVSRGGVETARGDAPGHIRAEQGGTSASGSTFQPLEAEESKEHRSAERQHELGRDPQGRDERG